MFARQPKPSNQPIWEGFAVVAELAPTAFVLIPHLVTLTYIGTVAGPVGGVAQLLFSVGPDWAWLERFRRNHSARIVSGAYLISAAYGCVVLAYAAAVPGDPAAKWLEVPANFFAFVGMSLAYGAIAGAFITRRYGVQRGLLDPPDKYQNRGLLVGLLCGIAVYVFVPGLG